MKRLAAALVAFLFSAPAWADGTIDTLSAAGAIVGTESIPLFQTANPAVKTTPSALATYLASLAQTLTNKTIVCANNTCTVRIANDVSGLGTSVATFLATASSANLRAALTDETGTGLAYFQGGDLGTPSAGVATNLTGTASGLTANTVTTNANLTGPITSTGNATVIASQTGTGTKFVVDTSPTLAGTPLTPTAAAGTNTTQIASTAYVTTAVANAVAGVNPAVAVQAATTAASDTSALTYNNGVSGIGATLTGAVNTALTVDGYTFTTLGQRLLVKNDTQSPSGAFNGPYYVTQVQSSILPLILTRTLDFDAPSDMNNTGAIPVINGTVNAETSWLLTSTVNTVGTDPATFTKFSINPASLAAIATSGSASDLTTGTVAAARLPNPTSSTLGGIESLASVAHKWINTISTSGVPSATQPACADVSDAGTACTATIASYGALAGNNAWTAGQAVTPTVGGNTGAATVTPDASTSNGFTYTLTGNITLANPSNVKAGQVLNFQLTQDGTGSRTIALGSQYKFQTATAPTWSTGANKIDVLSCWWVTTSVGQCNALIDVR